MEQAPILGLDVGDKRVGVAVTDQGLLLAHPVATYERAAGKAEREIIAIIEARKVSTVVAGLPLSDDGEKNQQCEKVESFCRRLQKRVDVKLEFVDEYASSYEAEARLRSAGSRGKDMKRSGKLDAAAAVLILQSYLDSRKGQ